MPDSPLEALRALRQALGLFAPEVFSGEDCATLAEELACTAKACTAASVRAAARAEGCGAHRRRGFSRANEWLAKMSGTTGGQARAVLGTAAALGDCPATRDAVDAGELSLGQAEEILKTEAACPGTEAELLALARGSSLGVLRERARSRRHRAMDPAELHTRQQAARELRHWTDDLGMVRGAFALPPEVGVPMLNRLEAETDRIRKRARRERTDEPRPAQAADALVKMLDGTGRGKANRADMVVVWDRSAALAEDDHEGSAHIVGGGPVPVSVARRLAERAFVKAVVHDGVRIETVAHLGRTIPAELRTALELGDPPAFEGLRCIDCGTSHGVERDHVNPVANGGLTAYDNMAGRCWECHEKKTEADRQAGLLGGGKGSRNGREPP